MKVPENDKTNDLTSETSLKAERKRQSEADGEPGIVRIRLPAAVGIRAREVVAELKTRGAQVTLDELLSEYVGAIPEQYFDEQLQKHTPEPYYLEAAAKVPELREMLIRYAKKGLLRSIVQDGVPRRTRRAAAQKIENGSAVTVPDTTIAGAEG